MAHGREASAWTPLPVHCTGSVSLEAAAHLRVMDASAWMPPPNSLRLMHRPGRRRPLPLHELRLSGPRRTDKGRRLHHHAAISINRRPQTSPSFWTARESPTIQPCSFLDFRLDD